MWMRLCSSVSAPTSVFDEVGRVFGFAPIVSPIQLRSEESVFITVPFYTSYFLNLTFGGVTLTGLAVDTPLLLPDFVFSIAAVSL